MRNVLNILFLAVYLFSGVAPALHVHDHACDSPLDYATSDVVETHDHRCCSHDVDAGHCDEKTLGHSHNHIPSSPHEHCDDCVICQAAMQASVEVYVATCDGDCDLIESVTHQAEIDFADSDHASPSVRGPPVGNC